jgi:hypothetical protein
MCLNTSVLAKSIMGRREYSIHAEFYTQMSNPSKNSKPAGILQLLNSSMGSIQSCLPVVFVSSDGHTTVSISLSRMSSRFSLEILSYIFVWSHFWSDGQMVKVNIFLHQRSLLESVKWLSVTLIHLLYKWRRVIITLSARSCLSCYTHQAG